jgi:hypothetical protein
VRALLKWLGRRPAASPLSTWDVYMSLGRWMLALTVGPCLVGVSGKFGWPLLVCGAVVWTATWLAFYRRTLRHWALFERRRARRRPTKDM